MNTYYRLTWLWLLLLSLPLAAQNYPSIREATLAANYEEARNALEKIAPQTPPEKVRYLAEMGMWYVHHADFDSAYTVLQQGLKMAKQLDGKTAFSADVSSVLSFFGNLVPL